MNTASTQPRTRKPRNGPTAESILSAALPEVTELSDPEAEAEWVKAGGPSRDEGLEVKQREQQ